MQYKGIFILNFSHGTKLSLFLLENANILIYLVAIFLSISIFNFIVMVFNYFVLIQQWVSPENIILCLNGSYLNCFINCFIAYFDALYSDFFFHISFIGEINQSVLASIKAVFVVHLLSSSSPMLSLLVLVFHVKIYILNISCLHVA